MGFFILIFIEWKINSDKKYEACMAMVVENLGKFGLVEYGSKGGTLHRFGIKIRNYIV